MTWSCPNTDCPPTENAPKELNGAAASHQLVTIDDLAELLQVSRETIYSWSKRGIGPPYHKAGKHIRYKASDVQASLPSAPATAAGRTVEVSSPNFSDQLL
jgi:excisionase family DNA binding protein